MNDIELMRYLGDLRDEIESKAEAADDDLEPGLARAVEIVDARG